MDMTQTIAVRVPLSCNACLSSFSIATWWLSWTLCPHRLRSWNCKETRLSS